VIEQFPRGACILGSDKPDLTQNTQGAQRYIFEIADRRGDNI
jgi:hypothetical protein